ncbi:MAG: rhamnulose-phosphate aldolase/alcohol dehydrogenase [Thermomicrobiales bacterium]|jgi:rhamnose utilization protein RhaD (predicted bifunctional aldolase and dehydrogenase)|nr:rhamnulose-phosphate aldolase/alcohol dehydrogenase [Thermomicrobiales bacterium]
MRREAAVSVPGKTELQRLVNRSRLIGADPTLVVHGGGNTSSKIVETDHLGRERVVLRVKGSGTDLKTIGADGFPGLFLDELLPLRERAAMTDEEMVAYLAHCMVEPGSRRPSIETLLHAFLPARHVDHVHADAICALTNTPDAERHVREALGPDVALVPYIRPGFDLSRQVADLAGARAVVLDKHGLVTWGDSHEESYGTTLDLVARAEAYLTERERHHEAYAPDLDAATTEALLLELRGLLSRDGARVLIVDRGQRALADRADVDLVATSARATPDHVLRIGARSLVVRDAEAVAEAVGAFEEQYRAYFARHRHRLPDGMGMLSPLPRVVLVPGLGCIAAGADARTARVNAEIAARSHLVTARVLDAFGETAWLNEQDVFDFDYWPLELAKLKSAPPPRDFSGQVAIVTGAESALGAAVADRLAQDGAHLVLAGGAAAELDRVAASVVGPAVRVVGDDPVGVAIAEFGGVDVLVAVAPVSRDDLTRFERALERQGTTGALVGVVDEPGQTVDLDGEAVRGARANLVHMEPTASPDAVAEAIAFLASPRSHSVDRATIPVGAAPP